MSYRPLSLEYTSDGTTYRPLSFNWTTGKYLDNGVVVGDISDLESLAEVIAEFEEEKENGTLDPTTRQIATAGGVLVTYDPVADTLQLASRPVHTFDLMVALRELIDDLADLF